MRPPVRPLAALVVLSFLAGCASDGYLGEVEDPPAANGATPGSGTTPTAGGVVTPPPTPSRTPPASSTQPATSAPDRSTALWREAAIAHPGDLDATVASFSVDTPLQLRASSATLVADLTPPADTFDGPAPTHLAFWNVSLDGERGWLIVEARERIAIEGDLRLDGTLAADARGQRLQLASDEYGISRVPIEPFECRFAWSAEEEAACARWRALQPPPVPPAFANHTRGDLTGVSFGQTALVRAAGLTFFGRDANGTSVGPEASVDTSGARLLGLAILGEAWPFSPVLVSAELDLDTLPRAEQTTLRLARPVGAVTFPADEHALDGFREVVVGLRENATVSVSRAGDGAWRLRADDASFTRVATDGTERLAATLRLAPDLLEVKAPAGNYTRLQLILAETSQGASAQLSGYRIDRSIHARYVGHEPFAITDDLLQLLNETEGPVTPAMVLAVGVTLPFVALLEGFVGFVNALFPPSLAGTLGAGEGRVLTFELQMPDAPREVEIEIEARNADPVGATLRLVPE